MNRRNDPSCSRDFESENHQKESVVSENKQVVISQEDCTINVQHEPSPHQYQDEPAVENASDKIRLEPGKEDVKKVKKLHEHDDDNRKDTEMYSIVDILSKQIGDVHDAKNSNQEKKLEHGIVAPLDKNKILDSVLNLSTVLADNGAADNQESRKNVKPILHGKNDRLELIQEGNAVEIFCKDNQIVDPQAEDKIQNKKSHLQNLDANVSLYNDEYDNQNLKHVANEEINDHRSQSLEAHNIYNSESSEVMLTPESSSVKSSQLIKEIVKTQPKLQPLEESPLMLVRSTATQLRILSNLPSAMSLNISPNQPQSLFLLALSKLNESAISFAINAGLTSSMNRTMTLSNRPISPDLTPPASLGNAPPSYSFVLRQMAVRRRPRIFGTFVSSPSFIQHSPPPAYTASFDIYLDNNNLLPPPSRVYNFGFSPMLVVCPECGYTGMTQITTKITLCTHLCAISLCIMCCWVCAPLPYVMRSCKDVNHYCRNCRLFLGAYCPSHPANPSVR